jgi:hypothetical protein
MLVDQGYGYIGARKDTTQQSGQTPDKEVEIKNISVYGSGYTETDRTGMLSLPTFWRQQSEFVSSRQSGQIPAAVDVCYVPSSKTLIERKKCIREIATTRNFVLWLFLNNHNALWHVKICHDGKCRVNELFISSVIY